MSELFAIEQGLHRRGYNRVCGVDEAGRGPLAGPVVAAAVIMPPRLIIEGLDDSKKLSETERDRLFERIVDLELECAIGIMNSETIDRENIHRASLMAMRKAVMELNVTPDFVLVDGKFAIPNISLPQCSIIGGDGLTQSIAAASIVAKVTRDRIMRQYEQLFPDFSFASHKGYPTPAHFAELKQFGASSVHRRSFRPVAEVCQHHGLFR